MKAAIIFTLLLTTVLCRPARRTFSSSESSEEQVKPARAKGNRALMLPQETAGVQAVVDIVSAVKSAITDILSESATLPDPSATPDTASDQSQDDADDDDDEEDNSEDTEEKESEEDESGKSSTLSPVTVTPAVGTEEPAANTTPDPITPTIVIDQGRGDSLSRYPSDYKTILYVEDKSYQKVPSPYKSYEILDGVKKMAYDFTNGNEVEKGLKVYKALQVHDNLLEEDTSTPEMESQGLDTSFGASSPDQEASPKQALLPDVQEQEVSLSSSDAAPTDSSSATEEEAEDSTASPSDSASASQESEDSEDATATPGAADSQSDESDSVEGDSDEEGTVVPDNTTDMPVLAK
ncbi:unnamed protein product [Lota lota]